MMKSYNEDYYFYSLEKMLNIPVFISYLWVKFFDFVAIRVNYSSVYFVISWSSDLSLVD